MTYPDIAALVDSKTILSLLSAIGGAVLTSLIAVIRNRVKKLEYTVAHERIAFSSSDPIFGAIQVTWQGNNVTDLYSSRVEIFNDGNKDLTKITLKVFTAGTVLLSEKTEIVGTTQILQWTPAFKQQLAVPQGNQPTQQQFAIYNHSREYDVPVWNRGSKLVMTYLTQAAPNSNGPEVWVELIYEGVELIFRPSVPSVHGVPQRIALWSGLLLSIAVVGLSSVFINDVWIAALLCMVVGLAAQSFGALFYRACLFIKKIILR